MIATQKGFIRLTPKLQPNEMKWNPTFWSALWSGCQAPTKAVSFHMACLPSLSLSLSLSTLRSTFANIIVFTILCLLSKIHLQLGPWMVNSLHFVFYYLRITCKNILVWNFVDGCKFHYLLEGMMGGFDTLTRHFSHQAFTDENEWYSLKEVAFGIDYIVQFFLLLFMSLTVLFSIIFEFHGTN